VDVVNWGDDGKEIKDWGKAAIRNSVYYYNAGVTWTAISSANIAVRAFNYGYVFSNAGFCIFGDINKELILALLNGVVGKHILEVLSPTLNFNVGDIAKIPIIQTSDKAQQIKRAVAENVSQCRADWDSFETSWDFKTHPLLPARS
jgi:hypothetical protein